MKRKWYKLHMLMNNICENRTGESSVEGGGGRKINIGVSEHMEEMALWIRITIMKILWSDCESLKGMSWNGIE